MNDFVSDSAVDTVIFLGISHEAEPEVHFSGSTLNTQRSTFN